MPKSLASGWRSPQSGVAAVGSRWRVAVEVVTAQVAGVAELKSLRKSGEVAGTSRKFKRGQLAQVEPRPTLGTALRVVSGCGLVRVT